MQRGLDPWRWEKTPRKKGNSYPLQDTGLEKSIQRRLSHFNKSTTKLNITRVKKNNNNNNQNLTYKALHYTNIPKPNTQTLQTP